MVVDTISAVKSRRLLKVLLDSGSTMTVINKKCLPKNCKTRKTAKDRMVNTLAGSYNTSEMVVMRNLRLDCQSWIKTAILINKKHWYLSLRLANIM